jgi:hypothetical protein
MPPAFVSLGVARYMVVAVARAAMMAAAGTSRPCWDGQSLDILRMVRTIQIAMTVRQKVQNVFACAYW